MLREFWREICRQMFDSIEMLFGAKTLLIRSATQAYDNDN